MKTEEQNLNEPRKPLLHITDVISRFGECKYNCQLTHEPSWFHTIKIKNFSIYIEEWMDDEDEEICAIVSIGDKKNVNGFVSTNLDLLLSKVEEFVKSGL